MNDGAPSESNILTQIGVYEVLLYYDPAHQVRQNNKNVKENRFCSYLDMNNMPRTSLTSVSLPHEHGDVSVTIDVTMDTT